MDEISDYFIHKIIKKVIGKPTREDIKKIQGLTQEDAAAVPCELGGGLHGYLLIKMESWECADVTEETFEVCTNLGPLPTLATDATKYQITAAKEQHQRKLELFKEQSFLERSLNSKLINAFYETYFIDIKEKHIGCNNFSIPDMFDHLCKSYGKVTDAELISNKEAMRKKWDPRPRCKPIYEKVEDGVKFYKLAGMTTQDKEKIAISCQLIRQTGELLAVFRD